MAILVELTDDNNFMVTDAAGVRFAVHQGRLDATALRTLLSQRTGNASVTAPALRSNAPATPAYDESKVRRFDASGNEVLPELTLEDLGL